MLPYLKVHRIPKPAGFLHKVGAKEVNISPFQGYHSEKVEIRIPINQSQNGDIRKSFGQLMKKKPVFKGQ